jgi:hypothetical protein
MGGPLVIDMIKDQLQQLSLTEPGVRNVLMAIETGAYSEEDAYAVGLVAYVTALQELRVKYLEARARQPIVYEMRCDKDVCLASGFAAAPKC